MILCKKVMWRSNVLVIGKNGCSRIFMNKSFATNCIISNQITVFLFHIVIKKQVSSPCYKNEESKTINVLHRCLFYI